ncbi:hypothetical protein Tco_0674668, partial [Tanacetum coccineum]
RGEDGGGLRWLSWWRWGSRGDDGAAGGVEAAGDA